jgi:hypothetical protein
MNATWIDLDLLASILQFLNQFWIAGRLVYNFYEAMAGSLSMASTAVSLAKVAVVDYDEIGRSAVYSRYNNGSRTLPWGMPELTGESSVYSVSTCYTNRILGQGNNSRVRDILNLYRSPVCQYALEKCPQMLQNSIDCFQEWSFLKPEYKVVIGMYHDAAPSMQQLLKVLGDVEDLASYTPASVGENKEWARQKKTERITARLFRGNHYSGHCMAHIQ